MLGTILAFMGVLLMFSLWPSIIKGIQQILVVVFRLDAPSARQAIARQTAERQRVSTLTLPPSLPRPLQV